MSNSVVRKKVSGNVKCWNSVKDSQDFSATYQTFTEPRSHSTEDQHLPFWTVRPQVSIWNSTQQRRRSRCQGAKKHFSNWTLFVKPWICCICFIRMISTFQKIRVISRSDHMCMTGGGRDLGGMTARWHHCGTRRRCSRCQLKIL